MPGLLSIVSTPIGNLQDITLRALDTLRHADLIAAEDTRVSRRLLTHFDIKVPLISYHDHNEHRRADELCHQIAGGTRVALISDAGTPALSDPGYRLIKLARSRDLPIEVIPGPSAITAALAGAGLPTDRFYFEGFLPRKKGRRSRLEFLAGLPSTVVLFEAAPRLLTTIKDIRESMGDRVGAVCRELTKIHEEFRSGPLSELEQYFQEKPPRGEIVILITKEGYTL